MTFSSLLHEIYEGHHSHHGMSTERFTHIYMPIIPTITQKPWHAYFSTVFQLIQSVFYATNWMIDLLRFLFLDLSDIPGNFSNCHDLICTSSVFVGMSMGDLEVPRHFKRGTHYAALLSKLDGTAAVHWFQFFLYLLLSPLVRDPLN